MIFAITKLENVKFVFINLDRSFLASVDESQVAADFMDFISKLAEVSQKLVSRQFN